MDYDLKLVTAPLVEPVTLSEAKKQCRIAETETDQDDNLKRYISAARIWAENARSQYFIYQTWDLRIPGGFPSGQTQYKMSPSEIRLPFGPLKASGGIVHVKYLDTNGTQQTFPAGAAGYVVASGGRTELIKPAFGVSWPSVRLDIGVNGEFPVEIRCIVGFGAAGSAVPQHIRQAMLLLIAHWNLNREDDTDRISDAILHGANNLLFQDRLFPW